MCEAGPGGGKELSSKFLGHQSTCSQNSGWVGGIRAGPGQRQEKWSKQPSSSTCNGQRGRPTSWTWLDSGPVEDLLPSPAFLQRGDAEAQRGGSACPGHTEDA